MGSSVSSNRRRSNWWSRFVFSGGRHPLDYPRYMAHSRCPHTRYLETRWSIPERYHRHKIAKVGGRSGRGWCRPASMNTIDSTLILSAGQSNADTTYARRSCRCCKV